MASEQRSLRQATTGEWVVFAAAAAIIAAVVAVLVFSGITGGSQPPAFSTTERSAQMVGGRHQLSVTIKNVGDRAAADVRVAASTPGEAPTEQTIRFLAAGEEHQVTFLFPEDLDPTQVSVTVDAYSSP